MVLMQKIVLVTGGAGFIGSHTLIVLLERNIKVAVVDNLSNSQEECLKRVEQITGKTVDFHKLDLLDRNALDAVFSQYPKLDAVIHFAGLKAVGESAQIPLTYYENNIVGTINLLYCMRKHKVFRLIFSSSATVYGEPEKLPIRETNRLNPTNTYGRTKWFIEEILRDIVAAESNEWSVAILRYFNPVGAHESGLIGEDPQGTPNNLMPYMSQVAIGRLKSLKVFGNDYSTRDGTGIRDYIHVVDLAKGHLAALDRLNSRVPAGYLVCNLGTGTGYSVLEVVTAMSQACGKSIPYEVRI
jgi:UDP-glucose 4-epimerase